MNRIQLLGVVGTIATALLATAYIMNSDGSGVRNLTRTPAPEDWFAWSPG